MSAFSPGPPLSSPLILSLGISLGLSLFPWGKYLLYPFRILTTWVHESCHALMALLMGGQVDGITLEKDTSGLTTYRLPGESKFRQGMVASAGYLGTTLTGCLLLFLSQKPHGSVGQEWIAPSALFPWIGAVMMFSVVFWIRNFFGGISVALLGLALISWVRIGPHPFAASLLVFLAVQMGLNALYDIRTLFSLDSSEMSDARTMQELFFLPAWFWAILWMALSLALTMWTLSPRWALSVVRSWLG